MSDDGDPGSLAAERTALARGRTGLALVACGAAIVKGLPSQGITDRPAVGLTIVAIAAVWSIHEVWMQHRRRVGHDLEDRAAVIRGMARSTVMLGLAAFVVALFA